MPSCSSSSRPSSARCSTSTRTTRARPTVSRPLIASVKQKDAGSFQKENEISVFLPAATLDDIKKASTVRFRYSYKDGQTIDLPLNDADLAYWKGQVE